MARWDPGARDRLRRAALELYLERGFEDVPVVEIAERAGLTRRTFFRYFADKREVLFAGSERLPGAVADAFRDADGDLSAFDAVLHALTVVGAALIEYGGNARERRAVIAASPELQERERTKLAGVTAALADALRERGVADTGAQLLAQVGVAIFRTAFDRWIDHDGRADFRCCFGAVTAELRTALAGEAEIGMPAS